MTMHEQNPSDSPPILIDNHVKEYYTTIQRVRQYHSTRLHNLIGIHTCVEKEDWNIFKQNVLNKHGKIHSAIGPELTVAIKMYNEAILNKQQQTARFDKIDLDQLKLSRKTRNDTKAKIALLQKKLHSMDTYPKVGSNTLNEIIGAILDSMDKRTIRKYFDIVCNNSRILQTGIYGSVLDVSNFVGNTSYDPDLASDKPE